MDEIKEKAKKNSFYISLSYVGLGIISLLAMSSKALMESDFMTIIFSLTGLLTMPVSFLGFGILWGGGENARTLMIVVQLVVFAIFWFGTYRYLINRYRTKERELRKRID